MTNAPHIALMQAMTLPATDVAAEWVHLLPAGQITTKDGRGPYRVADAAALIATSLHQNPKLPIDENHAIDTAAKRGEPSPACGHIVELQTRDTGIWGRVEWNSKGKSLIAERAYLGISPAIVHDNSGRVLSLLSASLTNRPNLRGLTALHQENDMTLLQRLAELLGLDANTTDDALVARVTAMSRQAASKDVGKDGGDTDKAVALQSQIAQIGTALGLADGGTADAVLAAARAKAAGGNDTIVALQAELSQVTTQLNALTDGAARGRAEQFVDGEVRKGRVGVRPLRDHYISMHMVDPARVEKEIAALPILGASGALSAPPATAPDGQVALQSEQREAMRLSGFDPKAYAAVLADERNQGEAL